MTVINILGPGHGGGLQLRVLSRGVCLEALLALYYILSYFPNLHAVIQSCKHENDPNMCYVLLNRRISAVVV